MDCLAGGDSFPIDNGSMAMCAGGFFLCGEMGDENKGRVQWPLVMNGPCSLSLMVEMKETSRGRGAARSFGAAASWSEQRMQRVGTGVVGTCSNGGSFGWRSSLFRESLTLLNAADVLAVVRGRAGGHCQPKLRVRVSRGGQACNSQSPNPGITPPFAVPASECFSLFPATVS